MTIDRAAYIITMLDEPGLLLEDGEAVPQFSPAEIAQARRAYADWFRARHGQLPQ